MINYTIRPVLWTYKADRNGLFLLRIAVTIDRKVTYRRTPYKLRKDQWAGGEIINYPNAKLVNAALRKMISDIEGQILAGQLGITRGSKTLGQFVRDFKGSDKHTEKEIGRVVNFHGSDPDLAKIDASFLRRYEQHERDRGIANNTINTTMKFLRRIMRQAKAEKLILSNPFEDYKPPKYIQTDRTYLTDPEKAELFKLLNKAPEPLYTCLAWFLFGCYSGLRYSDWCQFDESRVENGFIKLRAIKNKNWVIMPIGPTLRRLIKIVLKLDKPGTKEHINRWLKIAAVEAKIQKNLTTHAARHTFCYTCAAKGIPKQVTAELIGVGIRTVDVYYHLEGSDIARQAEALRRL